MWAQAASAAKDAATVSASATTTGTASSGGSSILTPSMSITTAATLLTSAIPFDPTNPISAVRLILPISAWDTLALRMRRSVEWCQDRYFLLLQAKLSNSYPSIASEKLIFDYSSVKTGQPKTSGATTASTAATSGSTKKPKQKAVFVSVLSESLSQVMDNPTHSLPESQQQIITHNSTAITDTGSAASASVPGSTVPPNATVGVKRKKNSDATSTKLKIQKAVYPELSGPLGANPMVASTSQSSIISMQSSSAYSSSADPARDTMPSNHAFSSGFHNHTRAGNNSTLSNPMANNSTGVTMGIMASIPTMAEYEISSNNGSNDS